MLLRNWLLRTLSEGDFVAQSSYNGNGFEYSSFSQRCAFRVAAVDESNTTAGSPMRRRREIFVVDIQATGGGEDAHSEPFPAPTQINPVRRSSSSWKWGQIKEDTSRN